MDAMDYEFFIRRVYSCGRHGEKGADADIYRRMEHAEAVLSDPNWGTSQADKEYNFRKAFAEVKMYVKKALRDGIEKIRYSITKDEKAKLEDMQSEIRDLGFYNKQRLEEIIDEADEIFRVHGLDIG